VRTSSNTGKASAEAVGRRELECPEGMIDIAGIDAGIGGRDGVRLTPQRFAVEDPGTLVAAQRLEVRLAAWHHLIMPWFPGPRR
jgi:hypothetical protein